MVARIIQAEIPTALELVAKFPRSSESHDSALHTKSLGFPKAAPFACISAERIERIKWQLRALLPCGRPPF